MNATENRLKFEMEDAKRDLDWIDKEIAHLHKQRRKRNRDLYNAESQLKTLTDKA